MDYLSPMKLEQLTRDVQKEAQEEVNRLEQGINAERKADWKASPGSEI